MVKHFRTIYYWYYWLSASFPILYICRFIWRLVKVMLFPQYINSKQQQRNPPEDKISIIGVLLLESEYRSCKSKPGGLTYLLPMMQLINADVTWLIWSGRKIFINNNLWKSVNKNGLKTAYSPENNINHNQKMLLEYKQITVIHFWPRFPFYFPWKQQKRKGFLLFSRGTKWDIDQKLNRRKYYW